MAAKDVTVRRDKPLYITDNDRDFGTVTIAPGGQIFVQTAAKVTIQKLVKQ